MVVGIGIVTFRLHECNSLKEKRKIVKSLVHKIQNKFNASAAEVDANDVHQRAVIGFSLVGNDRQVINSKLDKTINMVDELGLAELLNSEIEIISL